MRHYIIRQMLPISSLTQRGGPHQGSHPNVGLWGDSNVGSVSNFLRSCHSSMSTPTPGGCSSPLSSAPPLRVIPHQGGGTPVFVMTLFPIQGVFSQYSAVPCPLHNLCTHHGCDTFPLKENECPCLRFTFLLIM